LAVDRSGLRVGARQLGGATKAGRCVGRRPLGSPSQRLGLDCWSLAINSSQVSALRWIRARTGIDKSIFDISGIDLRHRIDCIFLIAKYPVHGVKDELRHAGFAFRLGS